MPDNAKTTTDFLRQLRDSTNAELEQRKMHIVESLFNLRFRLASGQIDDPKRVRKYRKAIARINTILRQRELGMEKEGAR
ncbi:50S ribosomal protein L29 [bacterium]|nr:50S ribosomal protein L29 [bacterium]